METFLITVSSLPENVTQLGTYFDKAVTYRILLCCMVLTRQQLIGMTCPPEPTYRSSDRTNSVPAPD